MKPSYLADMFTFVFEVLLNSLTFFIGPPERPNHLQRAIAHYTNGSIWKQLGVGALIGLAAGVATITFLWGLLAGTVAVGEAIKG